MDSLVSMLLGFLNIEPTMEAKMVAIMLLVNTCLAGGYKILEAIVNFTPSEKDNAAAGVVKKVLDVIKIVTDVISANMKHK